LEKALELIGALVHDKTFCLCVLGEEKSIYGQRGEDVFVFKVAHQYTPPMVATAKCDILCPKTLLLT